MEPLTSILLPGESLAELQLISDTWGKNFPGNSQTLITLREMVVSADWQVRRAQNTLQQFELVLQQTSIPMQLQTPDKLEQLAWFQESLSLATEAFQLAVDSLRETQTPAAPVETKKLNPAFNAISHGCCSSQVVFLKGENSADHADLKKMWLTTYAPKDEAERNLVHELVDAHWFFKRATRKVSEIEVLIDEYTENPLAPNEDHERIQARLLRYQTTRRRAYEAARKAVEDFRKCRAAEKSAEVKAVITQELHTIHKEKNKPEPTWEETINLMRKKAIALGFRSPDSPDNSAA